MKNYTFEIIKVEKTMRTAEEAFDKFNVACTEERHRYTLARNKNRKE